MKRLGFTFLTFVFSSLMGISGAWAGVDYTKYHEEFQAHKAEASHEAPQKGQSFQHKSKYIREEQQGQGTVVPSAEKPQTGQKYERPDWAK